jgi:mRNA interferase HicA
MKRAKPHELPPAPPQPNPRVVNPPGHPAPLLPQERHDIFVIFSLTNTTKMYKARDINKGETMTGNELIRALRQTARRNGTTVRQEKKKGSGSHTTIYYGTAFTTLPDLKKEIGPGLLNKMLKDLGLTKEDLK